jgi:hypothetical protein
VGRVGVAAALVLEFINTSTAALIKHHLTVMASNPSHIINIKLSSSEQ